MSVPGWRFLILDSHHGHVLYQKNSSIYGTTTNIFCTVEKVESNMLKIRCIEFPIREPDTEVQSEQVEDLFLILDSDLRLERTLELLFNSKLPNHLEEKLSQAAGLIKVIKGTVLIMLDGHLSAIEFNRFRFFFSRPMTREIKLFVSITKFRITSLYISLQVLQYLNQKLTIPVFPFEHS